MKLVIPAADLGAAIIIRNGKGANGAALEIDVAQADEAASRLRQLAGQIEALAPKTAI